MTDFLTETQNLVQTYTGLGMTIDIMQKKKKKKVIYYKMVSGLESQSNQLLLQNHVQGGRFLSLMYGPIHKRRR